MNEIIPYVNFAEFWNFYSSREQMFLKVSKSQSTILNADLSRRFWWFLDNFTLSFFCDDQSKDNKIKSVQQFHHYLAVI